MSKPPRFLDRKTLTLQGERADIADAHVFVARRDTSISKILWAWLLPKIKADKEKFPASYRREDSAAAPEAQR